MPAIQISDYRITLSKRLGIRGLEVGDSVSPEIVPTILVDDFSPRGERGTAAAYAGAGGAGLRSEIGFAVLAGSLSQQKLVYVPRAFVTVGGASLIECYLGIVPAQNVYVPSYGELSRGVAPVRVTSKNNAAATAAGRNYFGHAIPPLADGYWEIPLGITLVDDDVNSGFLFRPTVDNTLIGALFEWQLVNRVP